MISQEQADRAAKLCADALSIIEKLERDFAEMKAAQVEFEQRMAESELGNN